MKCSIYITDIGRCNRVLGIRLFSQYQTGSQRLGILGGLYLNGYKQVNFVALASSNNHTSSSAKKMFAKQGIVSHDKIPQNLKSGKYVPPTFDNGFGDETLYNSIKDILLNPDFAPLMRSDLRGLPEAYIIACHFDMCLRDDGILYGIRLEEAGVKTTLKYYKDGIHESITEQRVGLFQFREERRMRQELVTYLKDTLHG